MTRLEERQPAVPTGPDPDSQPTKEPLFPKPIRLLQESLTCPICKDYFQTALSLPCSHAMCSLCLREALGLKLECPCCRRPVQGLHELRNERVLDGIVYHFQSVWTSFLEPLLAQSVENQSSTKGIKKKEEDDTDEEPETLTQPVCQAVQPLEPDSVQSSSVINCEKENRERDASSDSSHVVTIHDSDSDYTLQKSPRTTRSSKRARSFTKTKAKNQRRVSQPESALNKWQPQGDDGVICPLCEQNIFARLLNDHIDQGCPKPILQPIKKSSKSSFFNKPKKLYKKGSASSIITPSSVYSLQKQSSPPHFSQSLHQENTSLQKKETRRPKASVPYSVYTETQLRKLLSEDGLSTLGDKSTLIKRHKAFVLRYNSNLDALHPEPDSVVLQQVREWERASSTTGPTHATKRRSSTSEAGSVDVHQHLTTYSSEYNSLIEQLKQRKRSKKQENKETETELV